MSKLSLMFNSQSIQGVCNGALGLVVAETVLNTNANKVPWLVLCSTNDAAQDLIFHIRAYEHLLFKTQKSLNLLYVPANDHSPHQNIHPNIQIRLQRAAAFSSLQKSNPDLVVMSVRAFLQISPNDPSITDKIFTLTEQKDLPLNRDSFLQKLIELGYYREDPVIDRGSFCSRGDLIDLFLNQDSKSPIRVELFGDTIEKIRDFDAETQRVFQSDPLKDHIRSVDIYPAREYELSALNLQSIRENIKKHSDDLGISRSLRDPILAELLDGNIPPHADYWGPFTQSRYDFPRNIFNSWNILVCDPYECEKIRTESISEAKESETTYLKNINTENRSRFIIPPVDILFDPLPLPQSTISINAVESSDHSVHYNIEDNQCLLHLTTEDKSSQYHKNERILSEWLSLGYSVYIFCSTQTQLDRIRELFSRNKLLSQNIQLINGIIHSGFHWKDRKIAVLTDAELFGNKKYKTTQSTSKKWNGTKNLSDLELGCGIIHIDHGIGRYGGLTRLDLNGSSSDYILLEYANSDKLYLPVYKLNLIQKYSNQGELLSLDKLGGTRFDKEKSKVKSELKKVAFSLIQLYAERASFSGETFDTHTNDYLEFESEFQFNETPDQISAIRDIKNDVSSGKIMDRLICGDVGFGKTEVAMRAAFLAVQSGFQVAVLVPTTLLAHQHEQSFKIRFSDFPFHISGISRLKKNNQINATLSQLKDGKIDIVIGTHRLLSKDIVFKRLGLLIVDEEHRFGVEHKEIIKKIKKNTHVLSLSATPIPRTLNMALSGIRDISLIQTPPVNRLPIKTHVLKKDSLTLQRAIRQEFKKSGQVFYLHNRVKNIYTIATELAQLVPEAKIGVAHGQMNETELEKVVTDFYQHKINLLVCTSIIESGLDLPSANTIIIERADMLGLAQLYQIRGRVGRGQERAHAYLFIPDMEFISHEAKQRLHVMQRCVDLGSGFNIANHDLDIRGGGDFFGAQQSGHIAAMGYDLYFQLLEEAVAQLKGNHSETKKCDPEIKTSFSAYLSENFISNNMLRLQFYRNLSTTENENELIAVEQELSERFGPLPKEAMNLIWIIRLKHLLKQAGVDSLTVGKGKLSLFPGQNSSISAQKALDLIKRFPNEYTLTPDSRFIAVSPTESLEQIHTELLLLLEKLKDQSFC